MGIALGDSVGNGNGDERINGVSDGRGGGRAGGGGRLIFLDATCHLGEEDVPLHTAARADPRICCRIR